MTAWYFPSHGLVLFLDAFKSLGLRSFIVRRCPIAWSRLARTRADALLVASPIVEGVRKTCMQALPNVATLASVNAELLSLRARMGEQKEPALVNEEARLERRLLELGSTIKSADKDAKRIGHENCQAFLQWYATLPTEQPPEPEPDDKIRVRPSDLGGGLGAIPTVVEEDDREPFEKLKGAGPKMKDKGRGGRPRREARQRAEAERVLGPVEPEVESPSLLDDLSNLLDPSVVPEQPVGPPKPTKFRSLPDRYVNDAPLIPFGAASLGFSRRSAFKPSCEAVAARHEGKATRPSTILFELRKLGLKHRTAINCLDRMTGNLGKPWMVT